MKIKLTNDERSLLWAILPPGHPLLDGLEGTNKVYGDVHPQFPIHVPFDNKLTITRNGNLKGPKKSLKVLQPFLLVAVTLDDVSYKLSQKVIALLGALPADSPAYEWETVTVRREG